MLAARTDALRFKRARSTGLESVPASALNSSRGCSPAKKQEPEAENET